MSKRVKILNISFDNLTEEEFLLNSKRGLVVTPNIDFFYHSHRNKDFYEIMQSADFVLCDSQLIFIASKFLRRGLKQNFRALISFQNFATIKTIKRLIYF